MSYFQTSVGSADPGLTPDFIKRLYGAFFTDNLQRQADSDENYSPSESKQVSLLINKIVNLTKRQFSSLRADEIEDVVLDKLPTIANRFKGESPKELFRFVLRVISNACTDKVRGKKESSLDSYSEEKLSPCSLRGLILKWPICIKQLNDFLNNIETLLFCLILKIFL